MTKDGPTSNAGQIRLASWTVLSLAVENSTTEQQTGPEWIFASHQQLQPKSNDGSRFIEP
jgi:hypothetical protein